jgi:hypothetical protein
VHPQLRHLDVHESQGLRPEVVTALSWTVPKADVFLAYLGKLREQMGPRSDQDKVERRLRAEADSLVDEHWPAVTALARDLLEHEEIDAYEAGCVVAIAEGKAAEGARADYRRHSM